MKKLLYYFGFIFTLLSCTNDIVVKDTPENVFLTFWNTMNERYVYFDDKKIDWDSVYAVYYPKVKQMTSDTALIPVFQEIINNIKDRHVSISTKWGEIINYWPQENDSLGTIPSPEQNYFQMTEKFTYLDSYFVYQNRIRDYGYIEFGTFNRTFDIELLKTRLDSLKYSKGLIVDIRGNGGGLFLNVLETTSLFYDGDKTLFYKSAKLSPKRNDFGSFEPVTNNGKGIVSNKVPIILLTSSRTYSAANLFAYIMDDLPNLTTLGTHTGGGGGSVIYSYLPNGWILSYPSNRNYSVKHENMENGLEPNINIEYTRHDTIDTQLTRALEIFDSINGYEKVNYHDLFLDQYR